MALVIERRIGLGNDKLLFAIGGEIIDMARDTTVFHPAVRSLNEPKFIHSSERRHRRNQTDVRAFRSFHWANPAIMGGMHVADLEARAIPGKTAGPEGGQTSFVSQL